MFWPVLLGYPSGGAKWRAATMALRNHQRLHVGLAISHAARIQLTLELIERVSLLNALDGLTFIPCYVLAVD